MSSLTICNALGLLDIEDVPGLSHGDLAVPHGSGLRVLRGPGTVSLRPRNIRLETFSLLDLELELDSRRNLFA